jgi:hypothetical protein
MADHRLGLRNITTCPILIEEIALLFFVGRKGFKIGQKAKPESFMAGI